MKTAVYVPRTTNVPWQQQDNDEALTPPAKPKRRGGIRRIVKRGIFGIVLTVLLVSGFLGFKVYQNAAKLAGTNDPLKVLSTFTPSSLKTTDGHINILLAGYSADDPGHQGADLTDSIMIVSIDPTTKTADLTSVPRDLYVDIPGYGYSKINAAYEDGQAEGYSSTGYSSSGMALLGATITQDFGVHFDYDALINYAAVKDAVNTVGGVTIDIQSPDARGLYDPNTDVDLPNGTVTLTGQQALNLTRARGDGVGSYGFPDGDFDRTEHQQQLLVAIKGKASSASILSNPLKVADLVNAVGNNVQTNLTLGGMETLYYDSRGITNANIHSITLNDYNGQDLLSSYTTPSGEDALIPADGVADYSQIQTLMQTLLND
jgi:LCP family protein required for cell wall assembly